MRLGPVSTCRSRQLSYASPSICGNRAGDNHDSSRQCETRCSGSLEDHMNTRFGPIEAFSFSSRWEAAVSMPPVGACAAARRSSQPRYAHPASVLVERHVQGPVQLVLYPPVAAHRVKQFTRIIRQARYVVARVLPPTRRPSTITSVVSHWPSSTYLTLSGRHRPASARLDSSVTCIHRLVVVVRSQCEQGRHRAAVPLNRQHVVGAPGSSMRYPSGSPWRRHDASFDMEHLEQPG